jgi:[ribosomal protein S5]-alanine N-acetyltransferase
VFLTCRNFFLFILLFLGLGGLGATEKCALDLLNERSIQWLSSPHLIIRTPRSSDLSDLLPIYSDWQTVRYTYFAFKRGRNIWNARTLKERYEWQAREELDGKRFDFVLQLRAPPGNIIGRSALYPFKDGKNNWEIGITIHRPHWGNGYAGESVEELFNHAFTELKANQVRLRVLDQNQSMIRVLEKIKVPKILSSEDDDPEEPFFLRYGHYALTRSEWKSRKK